MASYRILAFAALLLVLFPIAAKGDIHDLAPALAPFYEKVCDEVECGKGTCKADIKYPFNFICECDAGWKRTGDDDNTDIAIKFLPCVIPNCTLDYSCQPAPPPVPEKEIPRNLSFYDPCYWIYCGEGTCNETATYKHVCECNPGYSNLLDKPYYPCYSQCTLGSDCSRLGISVGRQQSTPASGKAITFLPGNLHWAAVLILSMAMVFWK